MLPIVGLLIGFFVKSSVLPGNLFSTKVSNPTVFSIAKRSNLTSISFFLLDMMFINSRLEEKRLEMRKYSSKVFCHVFFQNFTGLFYKTLQWVFQTFPKWLEILLKTFHRILLIHALTKSNVDQFYLTKHSEIQFAKIFVECFSILFLFTSWDSWYKIEYSDRRVFKNQFITSSLNERRKVLVVRKENKDESKP